MENGRIVLDGDGERLKGHKDVQEFYLGQARPNDAPIATSSNIVDRGGGMAELTVKHLNLHFGGLPCSTTCPSQSRQGELFALIGPNGAGKTSVLNCISGIYRGERSNPSVAAAISAAGAARNRPAWRRAHIPARRAVRADERVGKFADRPTRRAFALTACRDAVSARRSPRRVLHREAVERIIDVVELERYRHAPVGTLPFGVQKIVGFARALAMEPSSCCSMSPPPA